MDCQITDLSEYPHCIPLVARWIHGEFWADKDVHTSESLAELLQKATGRDELPLSLLAVVSGEPVATVNLIENDDDSRTHLRPWLAALYVVREHRGRGIGSTMVRTLQERACGMGIDSMYLGTDIPNFYTRLGAIVQEKLAHNFCVMQLLSSTS